MRDPLKARDKLRKAVEKEFLRLKDANKGNLERIAKELGVKRQQMQQYAKGTTVPADVLLMAFLKQGSLIRIDDEDAKRSESRWWEFSMTGQDKGFQKPRPKPTQMSLFDALQDLQDDHLEVKIRKKDAGRLEIGLEIGFKKLGF
jgi:predicted DNA-binding protein (UPF0251 family)